MSIKYLEYIDQLRERIEELKEEQTKMSEGVDITLWAIKNLKSGGLVGNKYDRHLWKVKPTKAINHLQYRYGKRDNRWDLVPIKVRIQEVPEDD